MSEAAVAMRSEERIDFGVLCDRIEDVLRECDREGARALMPQIRLLSAKLARLRRLGADFATVSLSEYVRAVARLAGGEEECASFL